MNFNGESEFRPLILKMLTATLIALALYWLAVNMAFANGEKVTICHPPNTLVLSAKSAAKHLDKHDADYPGPCKEPDPQPVSDPAPASSISMVSAYVWWPGVWCWWGFGEDQLILYTVADSTGWCSIFGLPDGDYWLNYGDTPWTYFTVPLDGQLYR